MTAHAARSGCEASAQSQATSKQRWRHNMWERSSYAASRNAPVAGDARRWRSARSSAQRTRRGVMPSTRAAWPGVWGASAPSPNRSSRTRRSSPPRPASTWPRSACMRETAADSSGVGPRRPAGGRAPRRRRRRPEPRARPAPSRSGARRRHRSPSTPARRPARRRWGWRRAPSRAGVRRPAACVRGHRRARAGVRCGPSRTSRGRSPGESRAWRRSRSGSRGGGRTSPRRGRGRSCPPGSGPAASSPSPRAGSAWRGGRPTAGWPRSCGPWPRGRRARCGVRARALQQGSADACGRCAGERFRGRRRARGHRGSAAKRWT